MITAAVVAISMWICIDDLKNHYIRHTSLFTLSVPLILQAHTTSISSLVVAALMLILVAALTSLGGGDVKLFLLLFATQGSIVISLDFAQYFLLACSLEVVTFAFIRRSFRGSIPLAPAILAPFIALYLAI